MLDRGCVMYHVADPGKMLPDEVCKGEAGHLLSRLAMQRPQIAEQVFSWFKPQPLSLLTCLKALHVPHLLALSVFELQQFWPFGVHRKTHDRGPTIRLITMSEN